MTSFYEDVQEIRTRYPEGTQSAILPALRLAQERHGWLSREAIEETADALDLTPAYCYSVASFYDMFRLEPAGSHTIEVCTNVCCGLVNAQAVLDGDIDPFIESWLRWRLGQNGAVASNSRQPR